MDFRFSDEEDDFRKSVRSWVDAKYPKTKVNEMERHEDHDGSNFPEEYFQDLSEAGFLGVGIQEENGGQGGGAMIQAILMEELARDLDLDPKRYQPRAFSHAVSNLKNDLVDEETYASRVGPEDSGSSHHERKVERGLHDCTSAGCARPTPWTSTTSS